MLWEREVGGGYSGPIVAGDRVWVHTRRGQTEVVSGLTLSRGEPFWSSSYEVPFEQDPDARGHGRGPYATPSIADGRLFTLGVTSILSAWDAEAGTLLWRRDYSAEFDPSYPYFGAASSPLVWSDLCFVHFGGSGWEERSEGAMVALDVANGRERWRWDGAPPSVGASPVIHLVGGRQQLVFKTQEQIVALAPRDGEELWRIHYKVSQDNTIVTPLLIGNQLLTSDWDMGFHAWRIERGEGPGEKPGRESRGDPGDESGGEPGGESGEESWSVRKTWGTRAASMFMSSPVMVGEQVVGFSHFRGGQLFGLDPNDGEILWRGQPRSGEHASLVAWGNQLLVFQEDGSLVVGEVSRDGFRALRTYRLGRSRMYAHPAIVDNLIVVKDGSRLAAFAFR